MKPEQCCRMEEKGEIIILGDTVSTGYYRQEELTKKAFFEQAEGAGVIRGYHTGDKGYLEDGMLFYCGRIDLQIKLHGYRIELEDIENNIRRIPGIEHAVVLPNLRDDKVKSLTAYVVERELPKTERAGDGKAEAGAAAVRPGLYGAKEIRISGADADDKQRKGGSEKARGAWEKAGA